MSQLIKLLKQQQYYCSHLSSCSDELMNTHFHISSFLFLVIWVFFVCLQFFLFFSVYLSHCLSLYLYINPFFNFSIYLTIYQSIYKSTNLFIYSFMYLSIYLCNYLSVYLSMHLSRLAEKSRPVWLVWRHCPPYSCPSSSFSSSRLHLERFKDRYIDG